MHVKIFGPFFIFFCFPQKQGRSDPCSRKLNWSGLNGSLEYSKNLIQECTCDMSIWMKNNKLKLNDDKTDLLVLTARHRPQLPIESIVVGSDLIFPSETVKNLGTVFDSSLSLEKQVTAVCKADFYHL